MLPEMQVHFYMKRKANRRKKRHQAGPRIIDRYLELDEIFAVLDSLSEYPIQNEDQQFHVIRARYIILLLFYTGLRIAEAAKHKMSHFIQREYNWFLRVCSIQELH